MKITPDSLFSLLTPSKTADTTVREERLKSAAEAKLREAKAAAESLSARSSQASEDRKAAARQKVEQLKARLQMLRSMATVDPEGTARVAAQLARELGSAVKAYAAAGGNTAGMSATGVSAAPASGEAGVSVEGASAAEGGVDAAAAKAPTPAEDQASGNGAGSGKSAEAGKSTNPYQQAIDEQKAQAAEMSRGSGEQKADADLMAEVRRMAAELKQLVRQATERAKADDDDAMSPQEADELNKAVASMNQDISQASVDLGSGLVSLLV